MAIRLEAIDPDLRIVDRLFLIVSGYFLWKKSLLSVYPKDEEYTVIRHSDVTSSQVIDLARKTMDNSSIVHLTKPTLLPKQSLMVSLEDCTSNFLEDYKSLTILSKWFKIHWERGDGNFLAYTSEYASMSELKRFLSLGKPKLPEEAFPILENLVKNYKHSELSEQFVL